MPDDSRPESSLLVTIFLNTATAAVAGLLVDGLPQPVATAPAQVEVILDRTPFWAEMGGQLADHGTIRLAEGGTMEVDDVQAPVKGLTVHRGRLTEGTITVGERARGEAPERIQVVNGPHEVDLVQVRDPKKIV